MAELKPCPFCGHDSPYFERMGTPRWSCIVICTDCGARHESSDEDERSGWSWNQRAALAQPEQRRQHMHRATLSSNGDSTTMNCGHM